MVALLGWSLSLAAWAHSAERGIILLLPTELYMVGGALAVLFSFALLALVPDHSVKQLSRWQKNLWTMPAIPTHITSFAAFGFFVFLVTSGFLGSRDPLSNPLPVTVWTLWWVMFTVLQCLTGNLWNHLNPWTGLTRLVRNKLNLKSSYVALPRAVGFLPAMTLFMGFAWFELVDIAPEDPDRLAVAASIYWLTNFIAVMVFGNKDWFERGEPFAIFFRLVGKVSPFQVTELANDRWRISLTMPGSQFRRLEPLPLSGVMFVLLTLSTVSFDGLSCSFLWLGSIGINPLEFPGRSAVVGMNSTGLVATFLVLAALFLGSVYGGWMLTGQQGSFRASAGKLVYSIIPISLVFHAAHYLTLVLVNTQYAVVAFNDPLAQGWTLLGTDHFHVTTSFFNHIEAVSIIWSTQTAIVVVGHVIGIFLAHILAMDLHGDTRRATLSQLFLAALMVAYTVFGLWLLSTPSIG